MSKNTFVKAAAQGGDNAGGGGGGLPGTWTLVDFGVVSMPQNTTTEVLAVPLPTDTPPTETIYMMIVTPIDKSPGGDISLCQGSTVTAPPNNCIFHSMVMGNTGSISFQLRSGTTLPGISPEIYWAVYKVVLPP